MPAPETLRLARVPGPAGVKANVVELTDNAVPSPVYKVNGRVGVVVVKLVIDMQAVQDSPEKEPVPNPILPLPLKVTGVAVYVSCPSNTDGAGGDRHSLRCGGQSHQCRAGQEQLSHEDILSVMRASSSTRKTSRLVGVTVVKF